mgnify:CR=1 FL=1
MAEVFRATVLADQTSVAVKILDQKVSTNPNAQQRFAREAQVQAMIRHRNVAALLGSGITPQREPYLVVELLRGRSLRSVIKNEGAVSPRRAVSYIWQALQGLAAVHAAGVLHRDLKPANIMLEPISGMIGAVGRGASSGTSSGTSGAEPTTLQRSEGAERIVLIDFGFASLDGSAKLTQQGTVVGSLTYMAPERLRGDAPDERADLYSLGVVLYELLRGAPPYAADDDLDLIEQHLHGPLPQLYDPAAGIGQSLAEVARVALAKHPDERFSSAQAMAAALSTC